MSVISDHSSVLWHYNITQWINEPCLVTGKVHHTAQSSSRRWFICSSSNDKQLFSTTWLQDSRSVLVLISTVLAPDVAHLFVKDLYLSSARLLCRLNLKAPHTKSGFCVYLVQIRLINSMIRGVLIQNSRPVRALWKVHTQGLCGCFCRLLRSGFKGGFPSIAHRPESSLRAFSVSGLCEAKCNRTRSVRGFWCSHYCFQY